MFGTMMFLVAIVIPSKVSIWLQAEFVGILLFSPT